ELGLYISVLAGNGDGPPDISELHFLKAIRDFNITLDVRQINSPVPVRYDFVSGKISDRHVAVAIIHAQVRMVWQLNRQRSFEPVAAGNRANPSSNDFLFGIT